MESKLYDRVWGAILTMAQEQGVPPTQAQVARELGVSRQTVCGVFRALQDSGRIVYETRHTYSIPGAQWIPPNT